MLTALHRIKRPHIVTMLKSAEEEYVKINGPYREIDWDLFDFPLGDLSGGQYNSGFRAILDEGK